MYRADTLAKESIGKLARTRVSEGSRASHFGICRVEWKGCLSPVQIQIRLKIEMQIGN